jgi:hypothetical protein
MSVLRSMWRSWCLSSLCSSWAFKTLNYCSDYGIKKLKTWILLTTKHSKSLTCGQSVCLPAWRSNHSEEADIMGKSLAFHLQLLPPLGLQNISRFNIWLWAKWLKSSVSLWDTIIDVKSLSKNPCMALCLLWHQGWLFKTLI